MTSSNAFRLHCNSSSTLTDKSLMTRSTSGSRRARGGRRRVHLAKVVTGLLGVSSDDIFRRAERERRGWVRNRHHGHSRHPHRRNYAWQQLKTNEAFLTATLKTATEIVDAAVAQAEKYGVPRTATLSLLTKAEDPRTTWRAWPPRRPSSATKRPGC